MSRRVAISRKALFSILAALVCWGSALLNTRPATEEGFYASLFFGVLSLVLAVRSLTDVWHGRVAKASLFVALPGAGLALLGLVDAVGFRAMQQSDYRRLVSATNVRHLA